jgi:hypothetical protein
MSKKLKIDYGTCWPDEYDWETQFAEALNGAYGFVTVDAGKLRGVALAYKELRESKRLVFVGLTDEEWVKELGSVREQLDGDVFGSFYRAIEAKLKEKNT